MHSTVKTDSHRVKAKAKAEKIKEQLKKYQRKNNKHQRNFHFRFHLCEWALTSDFRFDSECQSWIKFSFLKMIEPISKQNIPYFSKQKVKNILH